MQKPKKTINDVLWPFTSENFRVAWEEWLVYRRQRHLPNYVPAGLQRTLDGLARDAGGSEAVAIQIITQSIEKNWQGLFPLKNFKKPELNDQQREEYQRRYEQTASNHHFKPDPKTPPPAGKQRYDNRKIKDAVLAHASIWKQD